MASKGGAPSVVRSAKSRKNFSKPAGLITSIMRAGVEPAFHWVCSSPLGFVMYPPAQHGLAVA
jgi:hypothetical protein